MHSCLAPTQAKKGIKCTDRKCEDPECKEGRGAIFTLPSAFEAHAGMEGRQNGPKNTRILMEPDNSPGLSLR
jgi:hypothetical protein